MPTAETTYVYVTPLHRPLAVNVVEPSTGTVTVGATPLDSATTACLFAPVGSSVAQSPPERLTRYRAAPADVDQESTADSSSGTALKSVGAGGGVGLGAGVGVGVGVGAVIVKLKSSKVSPAASVMLCMTTLVMSLMPPRERQTELADGKLLRQEWEH